MNSEIYSHGGPPESGFRWLEHVTAGVLLLVMGALVWMTVAAFRPVSDGGTIPNWEVIGVIVLLLAALGLVSVVALLHTRK